MPREEDARLAKEAMEAFEGARVGWGRGTRWVAESSGASSDGGRSARTSRSWEGRELTGLPEVALGLGEVVDEMRTRATGFIRPPQRSQRRASRSHTRRRSSAHGIRVGALEVGWQLWRRTGAGMTLLRSGEPEEKIPSWRRSARRRAGSGPRRRPCVARRRKDT